VVRLAHSAHQWLMTSESRVAHWLRNALDALLGEMPVLAAGTSLFALLAAVPTIAAVVGVYGLVADPHEIHGHLRGLEGVLPPEVVVFVSDQLERQAQRSTGELGLAVATSFVLAMYSARGAARALIAALNRAYRVRDQRRWLRRLMMSFAMAAVTLVGLMVMFGVIVALPTATAMLHLRGLGVVGWIRWPILMALFYGALLLLYRYAPSPRPLGTERHLWPGSLIATLMLVLVSWALSQWVEHVSNYALIYGTFGSIVVVILWFYLSTISLVLGGFVNAELERLSGAPAPDPSMY
jgi:membrane protein